MDVLLGKTYDELCEICVELGCKRYVARQLSDWLYKKRVVSFEEMTNISTTVREKLAARWQIGRTSPIAEYKSKDGTIKYLFRVANHSFIETVFIPEGQRKTICVSSQIGCRMGCKFCMTATLDFGGNLQPSDLLNQIFAIINLHSNLDEEISHWNVVFMGEGEPLDNTESLLRTVDILTSPTGCSWSPFRITLSTVGIASEVRKWLIQTKCHIAISLHTPFTVERRDIMPIEQKHPLQETLNVLSEFDFTHQRKLSFEYIVWSGVNDSNRHIAKLVEYCRLLHARINLIPFHKAPENANRTSYEPATEYRLLEIQTKLNQCRIIATIRKTRGEDIWAACGMLVQHQQKTSHNTPSTNDFFL